MRPLPFEHREPERSAIDPAYVDLFVEITVAGNAKVQFDFEVEPGLVLAHFQTAVFLTSNDVAVVIGATHVTFIRSSLLSYGGCERARQNFFDEPSEVLRVGVEFVGVAFDHRGIAFGAVS